MCPIIIEELREPDAKKWADNCNDTEFPLWPVCTFARKVDCLKYGPSKCVLPKEYQKWMNYIKDFHVRKTDVWVATFPKCGKELNNINNAMHLKIVSQIPNYRPQLINISTKIQYTGTTWAQEMVWLIQNDLDYESAEVSLHTRFPYFE